MEEDLKKQESAAPQAEEPAPVDPADLAAPALASSKPSAAAAGLHSEGMTIRAFSDALLAAGLWEDFVAFTAHALPRRRAVWWAAQCARASGPKDGFSDADEAALEAAEKWVVEPTETRRRAAEKAASALEFATVPAAAAAAAFFSSGTISLPEAPMVAPPPAVCPDAVKTAVLCAAVDSDQEKAAEFRKIFASMALDPDSTADRLREVALAVAAEHTVKGADPDAEKDRLRQAANASASEKPSAIDDKRMHNEMEAAFAGKIAAEKANAEKVAAMQKAHKEAEEAEKAKAKGKTQVAHGGGK